VGEGDVLEQTRHAMVADGDDGCRRERFGKGMVTVTNGKSTPMTERSPIKAYSQDHKTYSPNNTPIRPIRARM